MRTILIADENIDTRFVNLFSDMDYRVVTTLSGVDAISKAKEIEPDIVMADVSLSDKDGYEVSREIKNNLLLKNTPVILLISSLGTFDETRAVEVRADDFIIKPFKFEEITKKVEFFISQNKEKKMRFTDGMLVLLVILIAMTLILYQSVNNIDLIKVESKLDQLYTQFKDLRSVNLSKIEPKLTPLAEREKEIVMTVNDNRGELSRKEELLRVKEEKLEVKDAVVLETEKDRRHITKISNPTELPKTISVKETNKKKVERKTVTNIKKLGAKKLELITKPVLASELRQPNGRETSRELETSGPEKMEAPKEPEEEELKKAEVKKEEEPLEVKEEKPKDKDAVILEMGKREAQKVVAEASSSEKGKGTQKGSGYLTGIKITDWSLYVASGVPTIHHVTIENTNDIAYKDIKVRAHYYYSQSYSNDGTTQIGGVTGILHVTLPSHSKKTYLEEGATLRIDPNSTYSMYVGARDIEVLGAISVPNLPTISQTNKPNSE